MAAVERSALNHQSTGPRRTRRSATARVIACAVATLSGMPTISVVTLASGAGALAMMLTMTGCEKTGKSADNVTTVKMGGKRFFLELAVTDTVRVKGLGGRTNIDPDGGMLFAFDREQVREFVMRDCPIPMDILYLDGAGRVLSIYTMQPEPPRGPGEGREGDFSNERYESRLKKYSSRYPCRFVIEVKDGTAQKLGIKEGDRIELDAELLKAVAK
jgi:uncharacterized protein